MPETQNIEYKSSWHEEYLDWICGFANAQGGKIYIGKDGKPRRKFSRIRHHLSRHFGRQRGGEAENRLE